MLHKNVSKRNLKRLSSGGNGGILLPIQKRDSHASTASSNLLHQRGPDGAIPHDATGQSRQWSVATQHLTPSTGSIRLNYVPPSQQGLCFLKAPPQENEQVINAIVVRLVASSRAI